MPLILLTESEAADFELEAMSVSWKFDDVCASGSEFNAFNLGNGTAFGLFKVSKLTTTRQHFQVAQLLESWIEGLKQV